MVRPKITNPSGPEKRRMAVFIASQPTVLIIHHKTAVPIKRENIKKKGFLIILLYCI